MFPRTAYEMTEADLEELLAACKPVIAMMIGGRWPSSPQENANRAWERLGEKMGFDPMTVRPVDGKGNRFFTAVPCETETQRAERATREAEDNRQKEIQRLTNEIAEREARLATLTGDEVAARERAAELRRG